MLGQEDGLYVPVLSYGGGEDTYNGNTARKPLIKKK